MKTLSQLLTSKMDYGLSCAAFEVKYWRKVVALTIQRVFDPSLYIAIPLCKTKIDLNQSSFLVQLPIYPRNILPPYINI